MSRLRNLLGRWVKKLIVPTQDDVGFWDEDLYEETFNEVSDNVYAVIMGRAAVHCLERVISSKETYTVLPVLDGRPWPVTISRSCRITTIKFMDPKAMNRKQRTQAKNFVQKIQPTVMYNL